MNDRQDDAKGRILRRYQAWIVTGLDEGKLVRLESTSKIKVTGMHARLVIFLRKCSPSHVGTAVLHFEHWDLALCYYYPCKFDWQTHTSWKRMGSHIKQVQRHADEICWELYRDDLQLTRNSCIVSWDYPTLSNQSMMEPLWTYGLSLRCQCIERC